MGTLVFIEAIHLVRRASNSDGPPPPTDVCRIDGTPQLLFDSFRFSRQKGGRPRSSRWRRL